MVSLCPRFIAMILLNAVLMSAEHPRLLFPAAHLPDLRARATVEPYAAMLARIRMDLDTDSWCAGPAKPDEPYDQSSVALRAAFLYAITGDATMAAKAKAIIAAQIEATAWADPKTKGLTLYFVGTRAALCYDLCAGAATWDEQFAHRVSQQLHGLAQLLISDGGAQQNTNAASNWQGARFSAAGLCLLASDEPLQLDKRKQLSTCYERVVAYMQANLGDDPHSRGWNCEGLGYTFYPIGNFVGPFAIAMRHFDPACDLRQSTAAAAWTLWTCYAALTTAAGTIRPDFSDDNAGTAGEGCYGLAFWMCPQALQPGLVWWYDRIWGPKGDRSYDHARTGTMLSFIFHPGSSAVATDPMKIPAWREGFADRTGNGFFTFRNRYRDSDDAIAQIFAKLRAPGGHSGPDSLSYRLIGLDTAWAVGGGRYGIKHNGQETYWRSQNTVYPADPDAVLTINRTTGTVVGEPMIHGDGSGFVVLHATQNNVGTKDLVRRFIVDHSASGAEATYVIVDTSSNGAWWQHCTVLPNTITVNGSTFTIAGHAGATLRGTVLYPATTTLRTGQRPRGSDFVGGIKDNGFVTATSADGCFVVVLTTQKAGNAHPEPTLTGTWGAKPKGTITVGGLSIAIDGDTVTVGGAGKPR